MRFTAAILVETGRPLELVELTVPQLKPGQLLVEVACSGVCHTQLLEARGHRGDDPYLPHCLGHEASGIVREVGPQVTKCQVDDRVILSWMKGGGADVLGSVYDWNGRPVNAGGVTTFQQYAVVSENRATVFPSEIDFRTAALLGCAVPTGVGAVRNAAAASSGQSLAVFGTGGVGLCSVAAAALAGAAPLIAIDINEDRLRIAETLGATTTVNASQEEPVARILELCPAGLDLAIECSGRPAVMRQALQSVRARGGTVVVVGNARHGESLEIDPRELNQGKRLLGTWGGDNEPDRDFPDYCELVATNRLQLAPLMRGVYSLDQINDALDDLERGRVPRPLIEMQTEKAGL